MIKTLLFLAISILLTCSETPTNYWNVQVAGAMHRFMKQGDVTPTISLDTMRSPVPLFGLGPAEDLNGEITVIGGHLTHAYMENGAISIDTSFNKKAVLLVYSNISDWETVAIPSHVTSGEALDAYIENTIEAKQWLGPVPFMLKGQVGRLEFHILNSKDDQEKSYANIKKNSFKSTVEQQDVTIIGFYSSEHEGIFTHHGNKTHLHFTSDKRNESGHVDKITSLGNLTLFLPKK